MSQVSQDSSGIRRALAAALLPVACIFLAAPAVGPAIGVVTEAFGRPALAGVAIGAALLLCALGLRRCPPLLGLAVVSTVYAAVLVVLAFWSLSPVFRFRTSLRIDPPAAVGIWKTDDRYGYRHIPGVRGRHRVPQNFDVEYDIGEDGCRRVAAPASSEAEALFLGGSLTFGHGVEGHEAYPAVLSERYWTSTRIRNCGVAGWGTAHAYLLLEDEIARGARPQIVMYGWVTHHQIRNYIVRSWVEVMASYGRRHPWFDIENDRLVYRGTVGLEDLPKSTAAVGTRSLNVTIRLLHGMKRMADEIGARFIVVRLSDAGNDAQVLDALKSAGIGVVDVSGAEGGRFPMDMHPDAVWHADLARLLATAPAVKSLGLLPAPER